MRAASPRSNERSVRLKDLLTEDFFAREIQPKLRPIKVREIAEPVPAAKGC
jgi:hypothetical protein